MDLRVRQRAIEDYRLWKNGRSRLHWETLVNSTIKRIAVGGRGELSLKGEEKLRESEIAERIYAQHQTTETRNEAWLKETGKSVDTFYRRLRELKRAKSH
jgi:hypothetical protein